MTGFGYFFSVELMVLNGQFSNINQLSPSEPSAWVLVGQA